MSEQLPDRPPARDAAAGAADGGRPRPPWLEALVALAKFAAGRLRTLQGALYLAFGAVLLINAWSAGPARWREKRALRSLTARGVAVVGGAWWRLDFDPRPLGADGTNWQTLTAPELCVRLAVDAPAGSSRPAVYCRQWQQLTRGSLLTSDAELAPGVPVAWAGRDGRPLVDLRFSGRALRWLEARPASTWFVLGLKASERARRIARSEMDVLWVIVDDPLSRLAESWAAPAPLTVPVAYDPADPGRALPVAALEQALASEPADVVLPAMAAVGGAALWAAGCFLLFPGAPKPLLALGVAVSVGLVPWWGDRAARALGSVWEPAGGFVDFFARELIKRPPSAVLRPPGYDGEPGDVRRPWTLETSRYAPRLATLRLERPAGVASAAELRSALAESVRAQAPAQDPEIEELLTPVEW